MILIYVILGVKDTATEQNRLVTLLVCLSVRRAGEPLRLVGRQAQAGRRL